MRVISGSAKGTKLHTLEGESTRPTLDRVKESLFNIIEFDIMESKFLDVFSGSGAIGIEAASRGAKKVIVSDNSKSACKIIEKNVKKTKLENIVTIYQKSYEEILTVNELQDIIFLDPPYESNYAIDILDKLIELPLIDKNTLIIVETDDKDKYTEVVEKKYVLEKFKKYGRVYLLFIKQK